MRVRRLLLVSLATAALLLLGTGSPAGAGGASRAIEITKVVEGDGPVGGYVVEVNCTQEQGGSVFTVEFDAAGPGAPETQIVNPPNDDQICTIEEIEDNGAESVAYECFDGPPDQICIDDQTVEIDVQTDFSSSSFTVTNTFADAPPPPPADVDPADDAPPAVDGGPVSADPGFTG
jgi:hypothetical protein